MTKNLLVLLVMAASFVFVACNSSEKTEETQTFEQVENLRMELAESGKEYLSFFSIEVVSFEEVVAEEVETETDTEEAEEVEAEEEMEVEEEMTEETVEEEVVEIEMVALADFEEFAKNNIDKELKVEGTVVHICKHGGKKMFIVDETEENKVKITANDVITEFDAALEGSKVIVTGLVRELRVDEAYLAEWEAELIEAAKHEAEHNHEGEEHSHEGEEKCEHEE